MNKNINDNEIEKIIEGAKPRISAPDAGQSEKFKSVLRARVLSEIERNGVKEKLTFDQIIMNNIRYWAAGAVVIAVVVIAVSVSLPKKNNGGISLLSSGVKVSQVSDKAFGSLSGLSAVSGGAQNTAANSTSGRSTAPGAAPAPMAAPINGTAMAPVPPGGIYYNPNPVKYVYKGDTFTQDQATLDVLKYVPTAISADQAVAALAQLNLGSLNLGSFGSAQLENITLSQDVDFGYTINVDLTTGDFSIYQNYVKWPQDNNPQPLTQSDIPSDDAIIAIANAFLSDHSFAMGNYGTPEVIQNNYGYAVPMGGQTGTTPPTPSTNVNTPAATAMPMIPYFPDTVTVLYPLTINGKTVYDSSGNKTGLDVMVNLRYQRVNSVSGATLQNYQASSYDAITDVQKMLSLAENPSSYPNIYMRVPSASDSAGVGGSGSAGNPAVIIAQPPTPLQPVEVDFGTPTMGYVIMYNYTNNESDEYLVPAFIFPVSNDASGYVYSKNIVVPLIEDFIQNQNPGGVMVPMTGK